MTELNRAQLQAWESAIGMASNALDHEGAGTARLRGRLRNTMSALRESVETARRLVEAVAGLRLDLHTEKERLAGVVDHLPTPYLLTSPGGTIQGINRAAATAVNVSSRALVGRNLLLFLDDRDGWMQVLAQVAASRLATRRAGKLRPRGRLQVPVVANLSVSDTPDGPAIQWFLTDPLPEHAMHGGRKCPPRPLSMPSSPQSS